MAWVVDTCVLVDIAHADPQFCAASETLLRSRQPEGLVVPPIVFIELAPAFGGNVAAVDTFLMKLGVVHDIFWTKADTLTAFAAWHDHISAKRRGLVTKRPVADILIGAFATRHQGLFTRNKAHFANAFPALAIVEP